MEKLIKTGECKVKCYFCDGVFNLPCSHSLLLPDHDHEDSPCNGSRQFGKLLSIQYATQQNAEE